MKETLGELGESELLRRLSRFAPPGQLSDDSAALESDPRPIVVNTDVLVDGIHFSDVSTKPSDVGWRAVAANLSDLAASGAISVDGITVALVAPGETPWSWVEGVYTGLRAALDALWRRDSRGGLLKRQPALAIDHCTRASGAASLAPG